MKQVLLLVLAVASSSAFAAKQTACYQLSQKHEDEVDVASVFCVSAEYPMAFGRVGAAVAQFSTSSDILDPEQCKGTVLTQNGNVLTLTFNVNDVATLNLDTQKLIDKDRNGSTTYDATLITDPNVKSRIEKTNTCANGFKGLEG